MVGSIFLSIALVFSLASMVMYFLTFRGYKNTINWARISYHGMAIFVIVASVFLWYLLLTHQYEYKYVYSYSNNGLSTGLLLSSFWGGQEGSFMLWLLLTSIIGLFLQSYASKRGDLEPRVMAVFALATSFLLVMVSPWFKTPFAYIWTDPAFLNADTINPQYFNLSFLQSFLFSDGQTGQNFVQMGPELKGMLSSSGISLNQFIMDGKGLNPQLLNFWMQIHPPILFVGFAMATVPFAFALAAMMKNQYHDWVKQAFPWVLAGTGILGLGIMLGGYWAYEMLGWGGYWAWDPVENSSLIPWLIGVASIHTLLVQRRSQKQGHNVGRYAKTNLILCVLTYILVLYSTFLTRSGVLGDASVHSFVDPGMVVYLFLVLFIGTFILLGFGMLFYRWNTLNEQIEADEGLLSKELSLFTATVVLSASAIIVLVGTSAPIFGQAVDTFFYNEMHLPIAIIIGLLNGISLLIKWKNTEPKFLIRSSIVSVAIATVFTALIVVFAGMTDIMMILLTLSTAFALSVNVEIAIKIVRNNLKMLGAYVAHIGLALFILGVIGSAVYSDEVDVDLIKGEPTEAFGYEMTFTGFTPIENNTKYSFNIDLKKGDDTYNVNPVMYISSYNNSLMREPAILNLFTRDIYFAPLGYEEGTGQTHDHTGASITLEKGGAAEVGNVKLTFTEFVFPPDVREAMMAGEDFEIGVQLLVEREGLSKETRVALENKNGERTLTSSVLEELDVKIQLLNLDASGVVNLEVTKLDGSSLTGEQEVTGEKKEMLSVTAAIKPYISLVWIGVLVMFLGFIVSVGKRLKDSFA